MVPPVFEGVASKIRLGWSFCQGSLTVQTKSNSRVRVYKKQSNGKWQHIKEATRESKWHFTRTLRGLSCDGLKVTGSNTEHRKRLGWLQVPGSVFAWLWNMKYKSRQGVNSGHLYCRPMWLPHLTWRCYLNSHMPVPVSERSVRMPVSEYRSVVLRIHTRPRAAERFGGWSQYNIQRGISKAEKQTGMFRIFLLHLPCNPFHPEKAC